VSCCNVIEPLLSSPLCFSQLAVACSSSRFTFRTYREGMASKHMHPTPLDGVN